jgi:patatin-like phospholipase/acyl hydrolase
VFAGVAWLIFLGRPRTPPPLVPDGVEDAGWPSPISVEPTGHGACIRVLAIDGGGVPGLIPALMLERIEQLTKKSTADLFDLIVGTSTGSTLALGLTRRKDADAARPAYTASEIVGLFNENAATIFPSDFAALRWVQQFFRPKYQPQAIEAVFERYFGDVRYSEALTQVAVFAYDIKNKRRIWFGETGHNDLL